MRDMIRMTAVVLLAGMTGCTIVPPPPPPQPLLVAYPGQGKDLGLFQQDDNFCKTVSASPPAPPPGAPAAAPPPGAEPVPGEVPMLTPGQVYLRCMAARGNVIQPLPQAGPPPVYAYYAPYPVYGLYGGYYPWLYGGYFGFGFGYGGYRGYGFRDEFFRRGYGGGFRDGGFRGGGFRGEGGFRR